MFGPLALTALAIRLADTWTRERERESPRKRRKDQLANRELTLFRLNRLNAALSVQAKVRQNDG
jgi:hypothetical protein